MTDTKTNTIPDNSNDATKFLVALVFLNAKSKLKDRYTASNAGGKSGISFGLSQSDAPNNPAASAFLLDAFDKLVDKSTSLPRHLRTTGADMETLRKALKNHRDVNLHVALKDNKALWGKINAVLGADNDYSPEGFLEAARKDIDERDKAQLGTAAGYMDAMIERVGRDGADPGVFSPSNPDFLKALALTAAWGNRVRDGVDDMKDYLAGKSVPFNGRDHSIDLPPTLADVTFYLQNQKPFKSEAFDRWKDRVLGGIDDTKAKLHAHGIALEVIGSSQPSEGRLRLTPVGPVYDRNVHATGNETPMNEPLKPSVPIPGLPPADESSGLRFEDVDDSTLAMEENAEVQATEQAAAEAYADLRNRRIGRLKHALMEARKVDADDWAEIVSISEETGLSIDTVELEKDLIKERLAEKKYMAEFDLDELHDDYPATAEFLSDFNNTRFAHRDLDGLKKLEKGLAEGNSSPELETLGFAEQRFDKFVKSRPDIMARFAPPEPALAAPSPQPLGDMNPMMETPDFAAPEPATTSGTLDAFVPVDTEDKDDGAFGA